MIKIQVVTCNNEPPLASLSAEFDELGGNIGRAEGNALVLPDPERHISRTHASITFRNGKYYIDSLGTATPVYLNDRPLNKGETAAISAGDNIRIGDYVMQVESLAASGSAFDDISGKPAASQKDALGIFNEPVNHSKESAGIEHSMQQESSGKPSDLPVTPPLPGNSVSMDEAEPLSLNTSPSASDIIPSDFDPFAELSSPSAKEQRSEPKLQDELGTGPASSVPGQHVDNLLDSSNPFVEAVDREKPGIVDPLVALDEVSKEKKVAASPVQRNDVPEIRGSYHPPEIAQEPNQKPPEAVHDSRQGATQPHAEVIDQEALLRAFLKGAGVPNLNIPAKLTPQLMHMIGQLLRESTQGTLDLLVARSMVKREMRAEMTMIAPQENNPLKFSPDVEVALAHLLAPKGQGFMPPLQAMKDAQNDLRSHQFGFMAGMQAALAGVLKRFSPQKLEQRLAQKSFLDTLFPMKRHARLWELFSAHYQDISEEAKEDFHILFGKEFLRAYEAQVAKLKQENKPLI